jgi:DNA (cytosine-5)-methyltransferase 1
MIFNNVKPIRLIELFAGIGSQAKALTNLALNFEHWRVCEFDEHAVRSYNAVHGTNFVTSDITKISAADLGIADTDEFTYLLTYSFPCQDLSVAGRGRGMEKGNGTRSGLLWEVERLLGECIELPQVLLMENVPQVHGKKNKEHFDKWIEFLKGKGYSNYYQDLNSNDYGIPQNRNRCYMVSILGDYSYDFPEPVELDSVIKDFITDFDNPRQVNETLLPYFGDEWKKDYSSANGCIKVFDGERQGVFNSDYNNKRIYSMYGVCPTITTHNSINISELKGRLNVLEQWKLMGFTEDDYKKASGVNIPEGELKKQAGNSIVVNVLMAIFKELFVPKKSRSEWLDELLNF